MSVEGWGGGGAGIIITWLFWKWFLIIDPMFWVCDRSSAASTSSRMYIGAGLNSSSASTSDSASSDRCPPERSVRLSFHTFPSATQTTSPAASKE